MALILKVYLEFSYKKIAEITGWSVPKIETLISRAKGALKESVRAAENSPRGLQEKNTSNVLKVRAI